MLLLRIKRESLLAPLQAVVGIVEKRHTTPILSNVLFEVAGNSVTLTATDIEIQVRTTAIGASSGEPAATTVGARKLQDILRSLPDGTELTLTAEDGRLLVKGGKSRFSLQTLPAADYPRMNVSDTQQASLKLPQKRLRRLLALVQYAMAQQDIRYYLNGLLLVVSENELRAIATDGHRLAMVVEETDEALPHTEVILPRKTVIELSRLLAESDEAVSVTLGASQAVFRFGGTELASKLIDGKFPDYERVIPHGHQKLLTLPRQSLLQSLQRAAILTSEKFRGVRLVLAPGTLKLVSSNAEHEEAEEEIDVDYDGEALDVGFNISYLLDLLNNVSCETIQCRLNDSNSSALITLPEHPRFKYVVMPMRI